MPPFATALSLLAVIFLAWPASAATRLAEGGVTIAQPAELPPLVSERPHLRPRPAPDRQFDLLLDSAADQEPQAQGLLSPANQALGARL